MGIFVGVGMGPGDPELVTGRAVRILREADRVFAPSTALDAVGRAESIVRQAAPDVVVERLAFAMTGPADSDSEPYRRCAARIVSHLRTGERVAFATLGDPNVYSTFSTVAAAVTAEYPEAIIETVPGIMAFQDLAARSGTVLATGSQRVAVVTALEGPDDLGAVLDDPSATVVVYKGGRHLPAIAKRLADAGRLEGAVVGELLGLPGQRVNSVADSAGGPAAYLATVIVPPRRDGG